MKSIEKYNQKLFVSLGSELDCERYSQLSTNEKLEELLKPNEFVYFKVNNFKEACDLCQNFINHFNLGGSNWIGGRIINESNNFIARISYNGRIWDNEDYEVAKEIIL
ncbi:hypothetical protein [Flavobacterium tegetincola]|uniref:hypothetical protein n=1 Tax=Flavobacterium tegetincola TaxID=150172 RepID=UPI00042244D7|nr:hypothetical protein [Flavobacterium tegetincola]